jgi:hypothetical protein
MAATIAALITPIPTNLINLEVDPGSPPRAELPALILDGAALLLE